MSKLFGAPFGLSLSTTNVDDFLHARLVKKLTYWSSTRINPTKKGIIANSVYCLHFSFFLSIYEGTKKGVGGLSRQL